MYHILPLLGLGIPFIQCLVFGALISPTDPIAVLGILKQAGVPKSLETKIAGESLFNDGMAVVVFIVMLALARGEAVNTSFSGISLLLAKEALGGIVLGMILGFIGSQMIYRVNGYNVHVLITLAIVMGGHLVAQALRFLYFILVPGPRNTESMLLTRSRIRCAMKSPPDRRRREADRRQGIDQRLGGVRKLAHRYFPFVTDCG